MPEDCAGGCVNFIVVLYITRLELDFINNCAVLYIQLNVHVIDRVRIHTGMVQSNGFCLSVANVLHRFRLCGLCRLSLRRFIIRHLPLDRYHCAGVSIDLICYLLAALVCDLHLIMCRGFVQLRIDFTVQHLR